MKAKFLCIFFFTFIFTSIITYSKVINVPSDYTIIQDAIDAADSGDVIIIEEGTYSQQFSFKGKAITIASKYFQDQDTSHISKTIIDGGFLGASDSLSLVYFVNGEDSNSVLCGLTLQNGQGSYLDIPGYHDFRYGGSVVISNSGATIKKNIIKNSTINSDAWMNGGAGIDCFELPESKTIIIEENIIEKNEASGGTRAFGGAIQCEEISGSLIIEKNVIQDNVISGSEITGGAGISIIYSSSNDIHISNNFIRINHCNSDNVSRGGGIYVGDATEVEISNNIIADNTCQSPLSKGGGIALCNFSDNPEETPANASIINNTVVSNSVDKEGGGIFLYRMNALVANNILRDNRAEADSQLFISSLYSNVEVSYSNIEGGFDAVGNIDADPIFLDTTYYLLTEGESPCIDAGNPDIVYNDLLDGFEVRSPSYGLARNDMGAYGGPNSKWGEENLWVDIVSDVDDEIPGIPNQYMLSQNFPNPFNPETVISYQLPVMSNVELKIYDVLGREVAILVDKEQRSGSYEVNWSAANNSSGVYFYKITAGDFVDTKKMILLR